MTTFKRILSCFPVVTLVACGGGDDNAAPPPVVTLAAVLSPTFAGVAGDPLSLDGSKSTSPSGKNLTYSWNITQKGNTTAFFEGTPRLGTSVLTEPLVGKQSVETATATFCGLSAGTYSVQLKVSDGIQSSTATTTITLAASPTRSVPRDATKCEIENMKILLFNVFEKNMGLKVPSSFKLVTEPKWSYYDSIGQPYSAAISFDFDAANAFGALLRKTAICPFKLLNGVWTNDLTSGLQVCVIN